MRKKAIFLIFPIMLIGVIFITISSCKKDEEAEGTFTDSRDGNVYKTIKIGNQVWMAENLRYLPSVDEPTTGSPTTPHHYVYDYVGTDVSDAKSALNLKKYGVLYNWEAAKSSAPDGWHLPTNEEWAELINFLGGEEIAGGKLKEAGTTHWKSPNTSATNESGFTALPGGNRNYGGIFYRMGDHGSWWSSTAFDANNAWYTAMYYDFSSVERDGNYKDLGFSVRCVKD